MSECEDKEFDLAAAITTIMEDTMKSKSYNSSCGMSKSASLFFDLLFFIILFCFGVFVLNP